MGEKPSMSEDLNQRISARITDLMTAQGYTAWKLNKAAGLTDTVRGILSGRTQHPRIDSLISISEALNVRVQDLLEDTNLERCAPVAGRLKLVREAFASSVEAIAFTMKITPETYRLYESGYARLPLDVAQLLAQDYGLTLDYIFLGRRDALPPHSSEKIEEKLRLIASAATPKR